jgi:phosphoglycolate phosphatase
MTMNLIFDFDGTLADSFDLVLDKINIIAEEFNFRKVALHEVEELRNYTSAQFIKFLNIPLWKLPRVILRSRQLVTNDVASLQTFANFGEVLKENVSKFLARHQLLQYFSFIHEESGFFGKKKALQNIIKLNQLDKHKTFYIGDETRDVIAAKKCGIKSVAVTWGFNSRKVLAEQLPDYLLAQPDDLLTLVAT